MNVPKADSNLDAILDTVEASAMQVLLMILSLHLRPRRFGNK